MFRKILVANDLSAPTRVDQVVEARPVDLFALDEVEYAVEVREVVPSQGQAQAHALAYANACLEAAHRALERAAHAAKSIVDFTDPV